MTMKRQNNNTKPKLPLNRETIRELATTTLSHVVGGDDGGSGGLKCKTNNDVGAG
jgi:hypothetical protein